MLIQSNDVNYKYTGRYLFINLYGAKQKPYYIELHLKLGYYIFNNNYKKTTV